MRFCSLGSGSRGNAHLVEKGETTLLIECGFPARILKKCLAERYISPREISAVLISHEHKDHIAGMPLAEEFGIPCHMSAGTARALGYPDGWQRLSAGSAVHLGELTVLPLPVPHDAIEAMQFVIDDGSRRLAVFTDLGHVPPSVQSACQDADVLVVECNYDDDMLQQGSYPEHVKARIAGAYGHLSNQGAAQLVEKTKNGRRRHIVGAHISEHNNAPALVGRLLAAADESAHIHIAGQQDGTGWIQL